MDLFPIKMRALSKLRKVDLNFLLAEEEECIQQYSKFKWRVKNCFTGHTNMLGYVILWTESLSNWTPIIHYAMIPPDICMTRNLHT